MFETTESRIVLGLLIAIIVVLIFFIIGMIYLALRVQPLYDSIGTLVCELSFPKPPFCR